MLNFLLEFYHTFVLQFNIIPSNHYSSIFNFLKQVIYSQDIFRILTYKDKILKNFRILLKDHFLVFVKYLLVHCWCEPFWHLITKWTYVAKNLNNHKNNFWCFFQKWHLHYVSKYEIILLAIYPNLWSCKAFSRNTIYEMKVCLNIDGAFKLFEIVTLDNFHHKPSQKWKKKLLFFYPFCFWRKRSWLNVCYDPLYQIFQYYYGIHVK